MNLQASPSGMWTLAKLCEGEKFESIPEKALVSNLCDSALRQTPDFAKFNQAINELLTDELIVRTNTFQRKLQSIQFGDPEDSSYRITSKGIFEFRKAAEGPCEKIKGDHTSKQFPKKFTSIVETIKNSPDLRSDVIKLCINNAVLFQEFITHIQGIV